MKLNRAIPYPAEQTFEGGQASQMSAEAALRRSVLSCLLWEDEFYEGGKTIADRIRELAAKVPEEKVWELAIWARSGANLRHVPLMLASTLAMRGSPLAADTIFHVINRADELTEFLAIHAKMNGVSPAAVKKVMSAQVKKGLAKAFLKFSEYSLAKYNRDGAIKLRDVLFLVHAKPDTPERAAIWKRLVNGDLAAPDTWEVALSGGADKRETFERLIRQGDLGYLALLRNLRNMMEAGCDVALVQNAITARRGAGRVLPFRYVAAARACPQLEPWLDNALCEAIGELPTLSGRTFILVDVSYSMENRLSAKSDLTRMDAAATLAAMIPGNRRVFSFSHEVKEVPPRLGMACVDAIKSSQPHGGTYMWQAINRLPLHGCDRLIVITDEQTADRHSGIRQEFSLPKRSYMINVASARNGVGYGDPWTHIDGFSEGVLRFIYESENDR